MEFERPVYEIIVKESSFGDSVNIQGQQQCEIQKDMLSS